MPRAFIAIRVEPTPPLLAVLRAVRAMGGPIKTVPDHQLHITLRFLGETDAALFTPILAAMREAVEGVDAFSFELVGLGAFPRADRPSVVWVGGRGDELVSQLVDDLNLRIDALGFGGEQRPWLTHLTLARVNARPPQELLAMLRDGRETSFGVAPVTHIDLMRSTLTPKGPVYHVIDRVMLRGLT